MRPEERADLGSTPQEMHNDPLRASRQDEDASVGELITRLSEQTTRLVRAELLLARNELQATAKRAGRASGLLGGAGAVALYGMGALVAAAIIALALVLPAWAAALIAAGALFLIAGIAALAGGSQLRKAFPPVPQQALTNVKQDIAEVKESGRHERTS